MEPAKGEGEMKRRVIIALVAAALTAMLIPAAFGQPERHDQSMVSLSARNQAMATSRGQAFYVNTRYGELDPWIANLIARAGYRVVSSS
jgi:histidinol phosphatase-like PHP family hydrolase